jgi:hypothetical protein
MIMHNFLEKEFPAASQPVVWPARGSIEAQVRDDVFCRKCRWRCARRSKRKLGLDLLVMFFFLRPFRCRSCRARYYRFSL